MFESIASTLRYLFEAFYVFNVNAFNTIFYFLKHNFFFIFVLFAVGYIVYEELKVKTSEFVNDERKII